MDSSFAAVFQAGLDTVIGLPLPDDQTLKEWPSGLRQACDKQTDIGWTQVLYDRLAVHWEGLSMYQGINGEELGQF